jgi:hypothetical protein
MLQDLAEPYLWRYFNLDPKYRNKGDPTVPPRAPTENPTETVTSTRADESSEAGESTASDESTETEVGKVTKGSMMIARSDTTTDLIWRILGHCTARSDQAYVIADCDKLWTRLRFSDLQQALSSRPKRASYIKVFRYWEWAREIEDWEQVFRCVWPGLEFVSMDMDFGDLFEVEDRSEANLFLDTTVLSSVEGLRELEIAYSGPCTHALDDILQFTPNLERLTLSSPNWSSDHQAQWASTQISKRPDYTLPLLTSIKVYLEDPKLVLWLVRLLSSCPNTERVRIEGRLSEHIDGPTSPFPLLAYSLAGCQQLVDLTLEGDLDAFPGMEAILGSQHLAWPSLQVCGFTFYPTVPGPGWGQAALT